jgi:CheY-like chemotaxis protein
MRSVIVAPPNRGVTLPISADQRESRQRHWQNLSFGWAVSVARFELPKDRSQHVEHTRTCRVLVVEDEAMIALLVEDMVLEFGSQVIGPVAKIEDALKLAREAEIDTAILDVNLGGTVIFPVAEALEERGIGFIFATGYGSSPRPRRLREHATLPKPFSYEKLATELRKVLAGLPCNAEAA